MGLVHSVVYVLQHYGPLELNLITALIGAILIGAIPGAIWVTNWVLKKCEKIWEDL